MIALRMLFAAAMLLASPAMAQTKITFGTDWLAEA